MGQDKLIPPLAPEAAGIITGSEQILKDYASASSLTARDIKRLIEDVLHNPDFNADDVDTDMLERLANSIDSGDLEIINMHLEGDGAQKLELFSAPCREGFARTHIRHSVSCMSALCLQGVLGSSWKQTVCLSFQWITSAEWS